MLGEGLREKRGEKCAFLTMTSFMFFFFVFFSYVLVYINSFDDLHPLSWKHDSFSFQFICSPNHLCFPNFFIDPYPLFKKM